MLVLKKHFKGLCMFVVLWHSIGTAKTVIDSTITTIDVVNGQMVGHAIPFIYDVNVDNTQLVQGTAVGNYRDVKNLMRFAVNDAKNKLPKPADILTRTEFEYHQIDTILTVKVVGYPGYYVNYRSITDIDNDGVIDASIFDRLRDQEVNVSSNKKYSNNKGYDYDRRFDYLMAQYGNPYSRKTDVFGYKTEEQYFTIGYVANLPYTFCGLSAGFGYRLNRFFLNFDAEFGYGGRVLKKEDENYYGNKTTMHNLTFGGNLSAYYNIFESNVFNMLLGGRVGYTGLNSNVKYRPQNSGDIHDEFSEKISGVAIFGPSVRFNLKISEKSDFIPSYSMLFGKNVMQHVFLGFSRKI